MAGTLRTKQVFEYLDQTFIQYKKANLTLSAQNQFPFEVHDCSHGGFMREVACTHELLAYPHFEIS